MLLALNGKYLKESWTLSKKGGDTMTMRLLFYILLLLWVLGIGFHFYSTGWNLYLGGGSLMQFLLFLLLGWKTFGKPIEG